MNGFKSSGGGLPGFRVQGEKNRLSQKLREIMLTFSQLVTLRAHLQATEEPKLPALGSRPQLRVNYNGTDRFGSSVFCKI
jgi:hypothetical protein